MLSDGGLGAPRLRGAMRVTIVEDYRRGKNRTLPLSFVRRATASIRISAVGGSGPGYIPSVMVRMV
jgi:hypothetical protein